MPEERRGFGAREARWVVGAVIAILLVVFALMNRQGVEIDYVFFSRESPLVWVIIVSALVGAAIDRLLVIRSRGRR
jgi:lipopolysaccharide assembly protein A